DGEAAAAYLRFYQYEVAVLDWRMPRLSGFDLVQRLRRGGTATPVLMLTARDTPADRIAGLDAGADDYLVKPFDFGELLARIRALQRRPPVSQAPWIKIGDVEFDPAAREVLVCGQRPALPAPSSASWRSSCGARPAWPTAARSPSMCGTTRPTRSARTPSTCTWPGCAPSSRATACVSRPSAVSATGSPRHESQKVQLRRPGGRRRHGGHRGGLRHRCGPAQHGARPAPDPHERRASRRPPHVRAAPPGHARAAGGPRRI